MSDCPETDNNGKPAQEQQQDTAVAGFGGGLNAPGPDRENPARAKLLAAVARQQGLDVSGRPLAGCPVCGSD